MKITSILPIALVGMVSTSVFADEFASNFKFLPESQVATMTLLNQGADLVSTVGMRNAIDVAHSTNGTGVFAAASTGYSVYETGSHINTFGNSAMVGGATRLGHNIVLGGFAEGGYSHYHTTNPVSEFDNGIGEIKGAGNIEYYGGGVLVRYNDYCINCIYAEASARVGYSHNETDFGLGEGSSYKSGGIYVGSHIAVGYESDIAGVVGYDLYGKYYYNHQTGDDIFDGEFKFANTNSHRTRFGGRFDLRILQNIRPYIGMAWEHEYDSFANTTATFDDETFGIPAPGVRGNTGIFEAGISDAHMSESSWSFDGSIQGYTGVRKGIGGMFRTHYVF